MHLLLSILLALCAADGADAVVDGVFRRQAARAAQITGVTFRGRLRYTETDLRSGAEKRVECERLISMRGFDRQHHEFGEVKVDGRLLQGAEREREIRSLRSKGLVARDTRMPFFPETRREYDYRVTGPSTWRDMPVWFVEFTPVRSTGRHISGFARVLADSGDIVSLEFVPDRLPFVVTAARMTLDYDPVHGHWLPVRFRMDMDLRLALVVELMRRHLRVEDDYWGHELTGDVPVEPAEGK